MKKQFPPGKLILICIALFAGQLIKAQILTPTVIASNGGFSSNGNNSLSYTAGEMTMVQTFSAGNKILTQGFQQPNENVTGLLQISQNPAGSFIIYPNPTVDNAWFGFQFPEPGRVTIELYNALGQKLALVYQANYENGKTVQQLNTSSFAAGTYFLNLSFLSARDGSSQLIAQKILVIR